MNNNNLSPEELQKAIDETMQKSFIYIEFAGPGIAEFKIMKQNITPAQALGAVQILELQVKNWWVQEENRRLEAERERQLSVPSTKILTTK